MTQLEKLKSGENNYTVYLETMVSVDDIEIVKVRNRRNEKTFGLSTYFESYVDGRRIIEVSSTWENAIIVAITVKYGGLNSQAGKFFAKMIDLPSHFDV